MKIIRLFIPLFFSLLIGTAHGQGGVISATEFMKLYKANSNLRIVDAGRVKDYSAFHIRNSISIPFNTLNKKGSVPGLVNTPQALAQIFGNKGLSNNSTIILYDGVSQKYSSRVYWILKYLGASHVYILHKDSTIWRKAQIPISSTLSHKLKSRFEAHVNSSIYATTQQVQEAVKNHHSVIIDARSSERYLGKNEYSKGHIPGAININYADLLTGSGAFKSKEAILNVLKSHGVSPNDHIILYCQTGIKATVEFVALTAILHWTNVKVYDGAYVQWAYDELPISTKAVTKPKLN